MALANAAPRLCVALYEAGARGDLAEAARLQRVVLRLVAVRRIPNHQGPLKEMMATAGRPVGLARRPLLPMTDAERAAVEAAVQELSRSIV